jgi:ribosome biogenesis GTPase A
MEPEPDNTLFQQWEEEEIELQKLESFNDDDDDENDDDENDDNKLLHDNNPTTLIKKKQSNQAAELPSYMSKILNEFTEVDEEVLSLPASKLPVVAVIGRPNTGKSTLVNKLTDSYKDGAIVHDQAGITRDRTYRTGTWGDYNFQVIDTGGIIFDDSDDIFADRITEQAILAL